MRNYFYFGETVDGYDIPVLNEREARAGAGILLLPAMTSFLISYLTHDFMFTKIFVTFFMIDFFIRVLLNPKYSPTLILGRIATQNQTPEYVGAPQKRFAWSIGLLLSIVMFFMIVVFEVMTPIKIIICLLCIMLLFSETAFGICLGCIIYHKSQKNRPQYCPGNVCQIHKKENIQEISKVQILLLIVTVMGLYMFSYTMQNQDMRMVSPSMKCESGKCGSSM